MGEVGGRPGSVNQGPAHASGMTTNRIGEETLECRAIPFARIHLSQGYHLY